MTVTTTICLTHEELHKFGITDEKMKALGYVKKRHDANGKIYEKTQWSTVDITKEEI